MIKDFEIIVFENYIKWIFHVEICKLQYSDQIIFNEFIYFESELQYSGFILINRKTESEIDLISKLKKLQEIIKINGIRRKYGIFLKVHTNDLTTGIDKIVRDLRNQRHYKNPHYTCFYEQGGSIDSRKEVT